MAVREDETSSCFVYLPLIFVQPNNGTYYAVTCSYE